MWQMSYVRGLTAFAWKNALNIDPLDFCSS
jgi:hypothetical protein